MNERVTKPARVVVESLNVPTTVDGAVEAFAARPESAILESSRCGGPYGRYSILACDPVRVVELSWGSTNPWANLRRLLGCVPTVETGSQALPFLGGWIGFVTYEAGAVTEGIAPRPTPGNPLPAARFALYDSAVVHDHVEKRWYAVAVDWPDGTAFPRPSAAVRIQALHHLLRSAENVVVPASGSISSTSPTPNLSADSYFQRVARVKRYIEAGDVYQVNLTRRFTAQTTASPAELYRRLRRVSPSTHGGLLQWEGAAIVSSSPELFLDLRGRVVVTRPIKGTRPRSSEAWEDAALRQELRTSEKDRAELTMIVDVLRNDLGRVCRYGTVRVVEGSTIEDHPTVFHQTATISGELGEGRDWADLLAAASPGGSITGAPKIRAMQIIRELEPTPRGVYCGSMGWIGLNGDASFNIAIRTLVQRGSSVELYAGGGIVADSRAEEEYDETVVKLRGMLQALNCDVGEPHALVTSK